MKQVILFKNGAGGVSIVYPTSNSKLTIQQVAAKSVPSGKPYKIVDASTISADRTFRNAWEIDEAELTDGVGA